MATVVVHAPQRSRLYICCDDRLVDWRAMAEPSLVRAGAAGVDDRCRRPTHLSPAHDGVVADVGAVAGAADADDRAGAAAALLGAAGERAELPQVGRRRPARRRPGAV